MLQDYNDCDYGHIIYINNTIYSIYFFQWPTEQVLTKYKWYDRHVMSDIWHNRYETCQIYDTTDMRHVRYMTQQIWDLSDIWQQIWDMSDIWHNRYETYVRYMTQQIWDICQIYDTTDMRHMSDIWHNIYVT